MPLKLKNTAVKINNNDAEMLLLSDNMNFDKSVFQQHSYRS